VTLIGREDLLGFCWLYEVCFINLRIKSAYVWQTEQLPIVLQLGLFKILTINCKLGAKAPKLNTIVSIPDVHFRFTELGGNLANESNETTWHCVASVLGLGAMYNDSLKRSRTKPHIAIPPPTQAQRI